MKMREIINLIEQSLIHLKAPDVGTIFQYQGNRYRVNAWAKPMDASQFGDDIDDILYTNQQEVGPKKERLIFCSRADACYVSGSGVGSAIAPIDEIKIVGRVKWTEDQFDEARVSAVKKIGKPIY